jgi:hypothetical protein
MARLFVLIVFLMAGSAWAQSITADLDPYTFETTRPSWGVQLDTGSQYFSAPQHRYQGFAIQLDYQALLPENWGVLGVGPFATLYPSLKNPVSGYAFGLQARYQFRYWGHQWFVPTAGYAADYLNFVERKVRRAPTAGLYFLLNVLDRNTAGSFFANYGVSRSYLVAETILSSDRSYFFGLRIEY